MPVHEPPGQAGKLPCVSHAPNRNRHAPSTTFVGLPTGSAIGIVFAALFTGVLLTLSAGAISWPLLTLYAAAVIIVTTLVNPKGLFLTVASAPLLFVAAVVVAGYVMARGEIEAGGAGKRAAQLLVLYPVAELFPVLFSVTLGSAIIAIVRIWLIRRHNEAILRRETQERSERSASNRRTNSEGRRARERAKSVPVQELLARASSESSRGTRRREGAGARPREGEPQAPGSTRVVSRLGDDLYRD